MAIKQSDGSEILLPSLDNRVLWQRLTPQVSKGSTRNAKEEEMKQLPERNFLPNFCQLVVRLCPEVGEFIFLL